MNRALTLLIPLSLALAAAPVRAEEGCPRCVPSYEEAISSPALLLDAAKRDHERDELERAFRTVVLLRTLHPESAEAAEAWTLACQIFKPTYKVHRLADPNGFWATSDTTFMFQWLSTFFVDDAFPQQEVDGLLLDMPRSFAQHYDAFRTRQFANTKAAQWDLAFEEDNGRIETITATRKAVASTGQKP